MKKLNFIFIIFVTVFIIISLSIGLYVNVNLNKLLLMEIYNYLILSGTITVVTFFCVIMLLWQKGENKLASLLKKALIFPAMFFISLFLVSFIFPHSFNLDVTYMNEKVSVFDYNNLQSGTSIYSERYQPYQLILRINVYAMIALISLSILRYVISSLRNKNINS
ncbi:hypothetical protein CEY16_03060 [Halalkalibacillus sediminis]|uniref:Uncharacterized protein n=1 Tax=Halalkalibacillus sediminis TaxID=2018042 RepID=A0A2I0QXB5_9BACI|nr:hypothetical protein [Halalkalibacillus sediminis]PKR78750.1 hypothetical protein CEY16_03060 [Halalkalibacillus sediminis]